MKNQKLGQIMTFSRMFSFIAFLSATFAWILSMHVLFTVSILSLIASAIAFVKNKLR